MTLWQALQHYREKEYGLIGLVPNPPNHSADNGLLFTVTALVLCKGEPSVNWFIEVVERCWKNADGTPCPGLLTRYPDTPEIDDYDDNLAVCVFSKIFAADLAEAIHQYACTNDWDWGGPGWLGRFPIFAPTVKHAAGIRLSEGSQGELAAAFTGDLFSSRDNTDGRCLLFLVLLMIEGEYPVVDVAIATWRVRMYLMYPGGMKEVYSVYFGAEHPFALYGPSDFGEGFKK